MRTDLYKISTAALGLAIAFTLSCEEKSGGKSSSSNDAATKADILSWPNMSADEFGCMMEKVFGYRDERFNCSLTNYVNNGDPCDNTDEYYEGPKFPASLVNKVHPQMNSINVEWEGGHLQAATFNFNKGFTKEQMIAEFGLNSDSRLSGKISMGGFGNKAEDEAAGFYNYQEPVLYLVGFEHNGAGDVGCDDGEEKCEEEKYDEEAEKAAELAREKATTEYAKANNEKALKEGRILTDSRDGKTYRWVKIGTQTWMAENLNYDAKGSKCSVNSESNCQKYGRLYDFETAKTACLSGWHLPSNEEWEALVDFAGGKEVAGKKLKAKSGWRDYTPQEYDHRCQKYYDVGTKQSGNGTDDYGFAALDGGNQWWYAHENGSDYGHFETRYDIEEISRDDLNKSGLYSVRCVQD